MTRRAAQETIHWLQVAYSGELGASIAYAGHALSVREPLERTEILRIRSEELDHRARVGNILISMGGAPDAGRERRMKLIGTAIGLFCRVGGWFFPMWGAGRLERNNIREYEKAARTAVLAGHGLFADDLLAMAEVEWDHERYFRLKAASHPLSRLLAVWAAPPPREEIRGSFERFVAQLPSAAGIRATP